MTSSRSLDFSSFSFGVSSSRVFAASPSGGGENECDLLLLFDLDCDLKKLIVILQSWRKGVGYFLFNFTLTHLLEPCDEGLFWFISGIGDFD